MSRLPPQSLENERAVLGACMFGADVALDAFSVVAPRDFYAERHRVVAEAIVALLGEREPVDSLTVTTKLRSMKKLDYAGGPTALTELVRECPSPGNVTQYARIIASCAKGRRLRVALHNAELDLTQNNVDPADVALNLGQFIAAECSDGNDPVPISELLSPALEDLQTAMQRDGISGLPTGFRDLDVLTSGLHPGELVVLAARTGKGKSTFARNIAANVAAHGKRVLFFTREVSGLMVTEQLMCTTAEVSLHRIRSGRMPSKRETMEQLTTAAANLDAMNILLDDRSHTVTEVSHQARRAHIREPLDLVIVDYLQLVAGAGGDTREQEVASVSRNLKQLARTLNVPVLALSQFSRRIDHREDKHPRLGDLRESGAIEQDSDVVIFLERYKEGSGARVTVAKQRNGPLGQVNLEFLAEQTRLVDAYHG